MKFLFISLGTGSVYLSPKGPLPVSVDVYIKNFESFTKTTYDFRF